jgi:ribonuclease HII
MVALRSPRLPKVHGSRPDLCYEFALWRAGIRRVAGIDEVGRGPLAGPVVAAAVVLPPFFESPWLSLVRDSKVLPPRRREALAALIRRDALAVGLGAASAGDIDRAGLPAAIRAAATSALACLGAPPEFLLLDAMLLPDQRIDQAGLIDGDARVISIACAAIVAKVERDAMMQRLDAVFPGYSFGRHKGYGTAAHLCALDRLGPSPAHRRSFAPVRRRASVR